MIYAGIPFTMLDDLTLTCPDCHHSISPAGVSMIGDGQVVCSQCGKAFWPLAAAPAHQGHKEADPDLD